MAVRCSKHRGSENCRYVARTLFDGFIGCCCAWLRFLPTLHKSKHFITQQEPTLVPPT